MLVTWLFWVGNAATLCQVDSFSGIAASTLGGQGRRGGGVLKEMTTAVHDLLFIGRAHKRPQEEIYMPTGADVKTTMQEFYQFARVPGVLAAVDGSLIPIPSLPRSSLVVTDGVQECHRDWFCYKKKMAWLLLAAVHARGEYVWIKNHIPAATGDAAALNGSGLEKKLKEAHEHGHCPLLCLNGGRTVKPFIVADTAFRPQTYTTKCYDTPLSIEVEERARQQCFNDAIIRTRT
jgi:hypothetical protein